MANHISDETIEYVGILAKLELNEEEKEQAKKDMESMLDYIDKLNELDTEGVEPLSHVFPVHNVFREDEGTNGISGMEEAYEFNEFDGGCTRKKDSSRGSDCRRGSIGRLRAD